MTAFDVATDLAKDLANGCAPAGLCCLVPIPALPRTHMLGVVGRYGAADGLQSRRLAKRLHHAGFDAGRGPVKDHRAYVIVIESPDGVPSAEAYRFINSISREVGFDLPKLSR